MKALLEAGVHFGHQTRRWNPKMAPYIYTERNGIYIIDLQKTVKKLEEAYNFVRSVSENGQNILFVGTKKQAQEAIKEEASRCGGYYVNARWLGGMMTNFKTMRTRVDRLNQLKTMQADGTFDMLPKKEVMKHLAEIEKLEKYLGGVKEMKKLPGALFIVDTRKERNAIAEAHKLGIPVVAIADTNCDPDEIDYRWAVAIHGMLGYEMNILTVDEAVKARIPHEIEQYREYEHLIKDGELYRLKNPPENGCAAYYYTNGDSSEILLSFIQTEDSVKNVSYRLKISRAERGAVYIDRRSGERFTGDELRAGIVYETAPKHFASVRYLVKE